MKKLENLIDEKLNDPKKDEINEYEKVLSKAEAYNLALKLLELEDYKFRTVREKEKTKEMQMYMKELGYYVPYGETYIHEWCSNSFKTSDETVIKRLLTTIQGRTYIDRSDFIHPVNLINLKNGVFDLETSELLKHNHEYNFQGILNISYNKNAICPIWEKAINGMMPDPEDSIRMQKWFGYQFVRENREQIAHGIFGISGTGKSKIFMILRDLLGEKNVTNFELQDFNNSSDYSIGRLYGKYANINYDMSTTQIKDISIFKKLTSGDPIKGRNIYESPFEFVNYAKLSWACNKLPIVSDDILETHEFQRRVMLTRIVKGHDEDDKEIYHKFKKELPGIFNWAIEGHRMYFEEKGFNFNHDSIYSIWKNNMDNVEKDLSNHEGLQSLNDAANLGNKFINRINLEKQEILMISKLKKIREFIKDKELEDILEADLNAIQKNISILKKEIKIAAEKDAKQRETP